MEKECAGRTSGELRGGRRLEDISRRKRLQRNAHRGSRWQRWADGEATMDIILERRSRQFDRSRGTVRVQPVVSTIGATKVCISGERSEVPRWRWLAVVPQRVVSTQPYRLSTAPCVRGLTLKGRGHSTSSKAGLQTHSQQTHKHTLDGRRRTVRRGPL